MIETLWRNVQCDTPGGLAEAWRKPLCGEYDRHKYVFDVLILPLYLPHKHIHA